MTDPEEAAGSPLLSSKLHPPPRRRETVERPRLTARAVEALPALTLVSAPAGFGKTTLVADWLTGSTGEDGRTAWLSLDAADNDPVLFWRYVIGALRTVAPHVGEEATSLLSGGEPITGVVTSLLNDLGRHPGELVLVLDDYHVVESAEVHTSVEFLVDHLPPSGHVVIAGRADPPFPLARRRARGELFELRAADLRFTPDEASAYLGGSMGLRLTPSDVDALESRTEGWVAALQLAALSMQGRDDPAAFIATFTGDDRFVVDLLAEEVLERQTDEVRRFLLDTAVLDRFTGPLCDAVTGTDGGRATLEALDRANLFLVPLDDRREWYRYHHLFADVLRARLVDEDPGHVRDLHRRASEWYEATGEPTEAIGHAMAADDTERAARLVEVAAPAWFRDRQEATARRWLTSLPSALFPDRPVLSIQLVGARMVSGETTGIEPLLDDIERWCRPGADTSGAVVFEEEELVHLPAQVAVYRAALSLMAGDTAGTIEHADRARELAGAHDHVRRGSAAALVGLAQWTVGRLDDGARSYADAIDGLTAADHISDVLGCTIAATDIHITLGRLDLAAVAFESALELAHTHGVVRGTGDMHVGLSEVHLARNDLDAARHHLALDAQLGDRAGLPQHPYRSRVARALLHQAEGDTDAALALLAEAERVVNTDFSPPVRPVPAITTRVLLRAGRVDEALGRARSTGIGAEDDLSYLHEYEHVTLARVLLASGDTDAARRLLDRLLAAADAGGRAGSAIEILVLLAVAMDRLGLGDDAAAALAEALDRAEPHGQLRVVVDEATDLGPLLRAAADHPVAQAALAAAAIDRPRPAPITPAPPDPRHRVVVDGLSQRELDVLRLLRSDLSGPEIARELTVSLNTVRTHTKNIYMKLGVNNRRQAVSRAAELGL